MLIMSVAFLTSVTRAQGYEQEINALSAKMAANIAKAGKSRVAVTDFTDTQGNVPTFGILLAEELGIALFNAGQGFELEDRAVVQALLLQQKFTVAKLANAKTLRQFGQLAKIDALIMGTITVAADSLQVSVKVFDIGTGKPLQAETITLPKTDAIGALLNIPANQATSNRQMLGVVVTERDALNIRKGPGKEYQSVGKVSKGAKLVILNNSQSWYHVRLENGLEGYALSDYIKIVQE